MAQSLELNIKTTSDVPQAMDKAKTATVSFGKQVEDIQRKFSTSFRDIFLSIAGPMAIFAAIQNTIISHFEKIKKAQEDANQAAIDGTNKAMAAEDVYYARKLDNLRKQRLASEQANLQPIETARQFLLNDPRAQEVLGKRAFGTKSKMLGGGDPREVFADIYAKDPEIQKKIQALIAKDIAEDPMTKWEETQRKQKAAAERIRKEEEDAKIKAAKQLSKDGLSVPGSISGNVIGVGQNPVVTALQEQQVIARASLTQLEIIAAKFGYAATYKDVTASGATPQTPANASPSRAAIVTKNK